MYVSGTVCPNIDTLQNRLQGSQSLLSRRFGHPRVLGIPIPISLAFKTLIASTLPKLSSDWGKAGIVNHEFMAE